MSATRKGNMSSHSMSFKAGRIDERGLERIAEKRQQATSASAPSPGPGVGECRKEPPIKGTPKETVLKEEPISGTGMVLRLGCSSRRLIR